VQLDPSDAVARCALGRAYFLGRTPEKAIVELQKSIDLNPSHAHAYFSLGATLLCSGQSASSIAHLEMARRLSPRDYLLGSMMGRQAMAYLFMKQYDQAVEWGKRAVNEDGSWAHNYLGYVSALGHLGRLDEAR
jgi:adenylate cyclase